MFQLYPLLLEKALKFKVELRRMVAEQSKSMLPRLSSSLDTIPLAKGYTIFLEDHLTYRILCSDQQQERVNGMQEGPKPELSINPNEIESPP
jgi:hypothetical protein